MRMKETSESAGRTARRRDELLNGASLARMSRWGKIMVTRLFFLAVSSSSFLQHQVWPRLIPSAAPLTNPIVSYFFAL